MEKVLFICGSLNQTTIMHEISRHLSEFDCYFTPYYGDGLIHVLNNYGMLDFTVMGGSFRQQTDSYLK
ncbi:hypothetical protein MNBD_NITROSPIRAE03-1138, partial [hydrothermal vent metagenome]